MKNGMARAIPFLVRCEAAQASFLISSISAGTIFL